MNKGHFSFFGGNGILNKYSNATWNIEKLHTSVTGEKYKEVVLHLRQKRAIDEKAYKDKKRTALDYVTISGQFNERKADLVQQPSGFAGIDFDTIPLEQLSTIRNKLIEDPYIFFLFDSPSGVGFKAVVRLSSEDPSEYTRKYECYERYFVETYGEIVGFDSANKDISRACFLSWDPNAYYDPKWQDYPELPYTNYRKNKTHKQEDTFGAYLERATYEGLTKDTVRAMLKTLSANTYEEWFPIICALKQTSFDTGENYFDVADEWSSKSESYKGTNDVLAQWEKIHDRFQYQGSTATIWTIIKRAMASGWSGTITPHIDAEVAKRNWTRNYRHLIEDLDEQEIAERVQLMTEDRGNNDAVTQIIAEYLNNKYFIFTTRSDKSPTTYIYRDGIYLPDGMSYLKEVCYRILQKRFTSQKFNQIMAKIEAVTFINAEEFFEPQNPFRIACQNGIVDLLSGELEPFNPNERFFNKIPVYHNKEADCPLLKQVMNDCLKDDEDHQVIQELFGYVLCRQYFIQKAVMFTGTGGNGKGVMMDILQSFVGVQNTSSVTMQQLEDNQYAASRLHQRLLNIAGEMPTKKLSTTAIFKQLTGEDPITANKKYEAEIEFKNFATMVFSCNELPKTADQSEGFFRRWVFVDFPYSFKTKSELDAIPIGEQGNYRLADPHLKHKITSDRDEMSGILNFALKGFKRLYGNGQFTVNPTHADSRRTWEQKSNPMETFFREKVQLYSELKEEQKSNFENMTSWRIYKMEMYEAFKKYCHSLNIQPKKKAELNKFLVRNELLESSDNRGIYWEGCRFRS